MPVVMTIRAKRRERALSILSVISVVNSGNFISLEGFGKVLFASRIQYDGCLPSLVRCSANSKKIQED